MSELHLTNSYSRKKEIFKPLNLNKISLYACGPTVYEKPHVGNARALVVFDLLYRILIELYGKSKVTYVRNVTDIDDKIIDAAKNLNQIVPHYFVLIHLLNLKLLNI